MAMAGNSPFPKGKTNDSFMVHFPASYVRALPEDANSFARKSIWIEKDAHPISGDNNFIL